MAKQDYYEILGIPRNSTEDDIRKAFRKKALQYHPDRNKTPGSEEKFKEINEAYQIMTDPQKRAQYDRFGHAGVTGNGISDQPFDGSDIFGGFGEIFDSFFGDISGHRANQPQQGNDLQQRMTLTLEESAFGTERETEVNRLERCHHCTGTGSEPKTTTSTCATCRGSGQVRRTQRSIFGQFAQIGSCPTCQGKGTIISTPCTNCRAAGMERQQRRISVRIPAGVAEGMQVRLTGEGDAGRNSGPPGNLYVLIQVKKHPLFTRDGYDLTYQLPINLAEAALGVEKDVPTLDKQLQALNIPQGTQPGAQFRLRGKGIPHLNSTRKGDLRVVINLQVPKSLNSQQRLLLEELVQSFSDQDESVSGPSENHDKEQGKDKGLFERIKDAI
jgi:molecular chaperone DnaJ